MPDASKLLDIIAKVAPVGVVTGAAGYFARRLQTEGRKKRMREQLYREISNNYQRMLDRISSATAVTASGERAPYPFYLKLDLSFNIWSFYNDEKRREMLFDLKEAEAIGRIYDKFLGIGGDDPPEIARLRGKLTAAGVEDHRSDELSRLSEAKTRGAAAMEVDDCLLDGTLDRKLYRKVSSPKAQKFMDDLLNAKRQSYRTFLIPH